jgi:ribosome biogenesis GTPase A
VDSDSGLIGALTKAVQPPIHPTAREQALIEGLEVLSMRLAGQTLQVAVVGQFKRGKSSVLNALLGVDVLPTGVLPLTALPTFITASEAFEITVRLASGVVEHFVAASAGDLEDVLAGYVAEGENPANLKGVEHVEIGAPSPLLQRGVIFIDTPGIGSTLIHNTAAAQAALPECDLAVMVLSPDPPITQAEIDYLEQVRRSAGATVFVLNKIDMVTASDAERSAAFLKVVLDQNGFGGSRVLPISARRALAGHEDESGVPELRGHLAEMIARNDGHLLEQAISQKAVQLIGDLAFENDLVRAALVAPLESLEVQHRALRQGADQLAIEQCIAADRLKGDRQRLLTEVDQDAPKLAKTLQARLKDELDREIALGCKPRAAWHRVRANLSKTLDAVQSSVLDRHRARVNEVMADHERRAEARLAEARQAAATIMGLPYRPPQSDSAFTLAFEPYWVERPHDSLGATAASAMERIIPGPWGRRLAQRHVDEEVRTVVTSNVEQLRWTIRLSIEETLRRFGSQLDQALSDSIRAVADAVQAVLKLRRASDADVTSQLEARESRRNELAAIVDSLISRRREEDDG